MKKAKLILICSIVIVINALLFGCSTSTPTPLAEQMDKSPFTGIPCAAPCWQGLVIGESSESEVMSTLPTLTFTNQDSIQLFRLGSAPGLNPKDYKYEAEIVANCINSEKQCLLVRTIDYVLTEIEVTLNYEITLDEAIVYLGKPEYIGYRDLGAERVICEVYLVWSSKQLILASKRFEGLKAVEECNLVHDTGKTMSSILISKARYLSLEVIENLWSTDTGESFEFSGTIP